MTEPTETPSPTRPAWARSARRAADLGPRGGEPIAPGRTVLDRLGGGRRYEVFLVWDDHRLAVLVAKVLRPDQAIEPAALRELGREAGRAVRARASRDRARLRRGARTAASRTS